MMRECRGGGYVSEHRWGRNRCWWWIDLQSSGSLEVGEHLDDMGGHRGRSWEMVTSGLETVLIGDPVDGEDDAIGRGERV